MGVGGVAVSRTEQHREGSQKDLSGRVQMEHTQHRSKSREAEQISRISLHSAFRIRLKKHVGNLRHCK